MRAFAITQADHPATVTDLPERDLQPDAVEIRVRAASINGFDAYQASGGLMAMMEHALPTVVGRDFAGVVDAVGAERTDVAAGDEVLGFIPSTPPLHDGTHANRIVTSNVVLARKPAALSFETAAAIPLAGATALDAVDAIDPRPGEIVLVLGATGGVGSFAVQLAAQRGATLIATARADEGETLVRALGAAQAVDWSVTDVAAAVREMHPDGVSGVIDTVNRGDAFGPISELVREGGRLATTLGAADVDALASRGVRATNVTGTPTTEKLTLLAEAAARGSLRVHVQRTFSLEDADRAIQAFAGGAIGKLVLVIE